jgi:predicted nucleic acid-binding Zn ribbon protein
MLYTYKIIIFLTGLIVLYLLKQSISIYPVHNIYEYTYWSDIEELCSSTKYNITFPTYKYVDNKCYTFKTYTCFNIVVDKCYKIDDNCNGKLQLIFSNSILNKCEQYYPYDIIISQLIVFFIIIISFITTIGVLIYSITSMFIKYIKQDAKCIN